MSNRFSVPMTSVRWIVGKLHCGTPDEEVAADAMARAERAQWNGKPLTASQKKKVVDAFLRAHHENQALYHDVMTGQVGRRR